MRISDWSSDVCSSDLVKARQTGSKAAGPGHIALFVTHPQGFRIGCRPARAREPQSRQRNAAGAKAVALRRQLAGQAQFFLFLVEQTAAILHARKGERSDEPTS